MNVIKNPELIYVRTTKQNTDSKICKLGRTDNIVERNGTYQTNEPDPGTFDLVFEVPEGYSHNLEKFLQYHLWDYHYYNGSATEFFDIKIMDLIEPLLIEHGFPYRKVSVEELLEFKRKHREKNPTPTKPVITPELDEFIKSFAPSKPIPKMESTPTTISLYDWKEREHQIKAKKFMVQQLREEKRGYMELPTGGGKSYIAYEIFNELQSETIVIISPRKVVNSQNISQKYIQLLTTGHYRAFQFSPGEDFREFANFPCIRIITCCTQSMDKLADALIQYGIRGITVWFDEAHWGIEKRAMKLNPNDFWLLDEQYIKYRLFTSASPNRELVMNAPEIFGELYCPITVKELIQQGWLSPICPFIYGEKTNFEVNRICNILTEFKKKERKHGFSFHNTQQNAQQLFRLHLEQYQKGAITIKPFLLISNNINNEITDDDIESSQNILLPSLDYSYNDVSTFEQTPNSIAYVVAKYSMGYDFKGIDYVSLSDPKMSPQDIIQCLGRGIRPDELGTGGCNRDKYLVVSLPVFIDQENDGGRYKKTVEVLKYLLYDVGLSWDDFTFHNNSSFSGSSEKREATDYLGGIDVKSILLDLVQQDIERMAQSISVKQVQKILSSQSAPVLSKQGYLELCKTDVRLPTDPETVFGSKFPGWTDYLGIPRNYYDKEACQNKVKQLLEQHPEIQQGYLDLAGVVRSLCSLDPLFPADDLWTDYYRVINLRELLDVAPKKKRPVFV